MKRGISGHIDDGVERTVIDRGIDRSKRSYRPIVIGTETIIDGDSVI